ncbi:MAG TPA: acyltransferase [Streptosporangiaceae bacterium]|nr:acyltransferase [Streptosporangiaceae bacterium]
MSDAPVTLNSVPAPAAPAVSGAPAGRRLAWLDALRGIAAFFVVFDHLGYDVLQHAREVIYHWFDPGLYGVFVFFMVSGYIVPASLERKGSVRSFWVSRVFRLYPLYIFALAVAVVLWKLHIGGIGRAQYDPETAAITHVLMLSNVLGPHNAINVIWTLSYEMAFYLLLTALFVTGVHKRSSTYALVFAVAAVVLGGVLPMTALSHSFVGTRFFAELADLLIIGGVALAVTRFRLPKIVGGLLAGATALVLVCFNSAWVNPFEAMTILALMFTGTMLFRAERGDFDRRWAIAIAVVVFVLAAVSGLLHTPPWSLAPAAHTAFSWQWITSLGLAGVTFAVGMACRDRKMPSALAWLGLVSYSVYLLHPLLIEVYHWLPVTRHPHPFPVQLLLAAAFVAVLLGCCALSYRFIEAPMQRQGRKFAAWLEHWFGPDTVPEPVARRAMEPAGR